jgi:hypothetical protein
MGIFTSNTTASNPRNPVYLPSVPVRSDTVASGMLTTQSITYRTCGVVSGHK